MDKLKQFRENLNKSPKEMSSSMGVSKSYYYKVESGLREPSYGFIKKFKQAFKVSVDEIFF
jgi:transcriptional regulator with XRE-family HTH domain